MYLDPTTSSLHTDIGGQADLYCDSYLEYSTPAKV